MKCSECGSFIGVGSANYVKDQTPRRLSDALCIEVYYKGYNELSLKQTELEDWAISNTDPYLLFKDIYESLMDLVDTPHVSSVGSINISETISNISVDEMHSNINPNSIDPTKMDIVVSESHPSNKTPDDSSDLIGAEAVELLRDVESTSLVCDDCVDTKGEQIW